MKKLWLVSLSSAVILVFFGMTSFAQTNSSVSKARCSLGCSATPQCEASVLGANASYVLLGAEVVTNNSDHPKPYQIEYFIIPGKPGSLLVTTFGYEQPAKCHVVILNGKPLVR